jgi:hypothetical protein
MGDQVFVCYTRKDEAFVLKLATNLKNQGVPIWLDQWDILPAEDWDRSIDKALYRCKYFLIILSSTSVDSNEVRGELRTALDENKAIVPVLYQSCQIPRQLRLIQYIDFTSRSPDDKKALEPILAACGGSIVKMQGVEFPVAPTQVLIAPSTSTEDRSQLSNDVQTLPKVKKEILPFDYFFLRHTSFLRKDKQEEYRKQTGVNRDSYDIRVIVDSYYKGALDRVEYVQYILHRAYPNPIQYRRDPEDKFMLKELANGEYVLMAKVFLKDRKDPVLLQRFITLWESGPRLP